MIQVYGVHLTRWTNFVSKMTELESKNKEMNLRFFVLKKSLAVGNLPETNLDWIKAEIQEANTIFLKLDAAKSLVLENKAFIRPLDMYNDFDIVQPYEQASGLGLIPLIIGAGIAVAALISAAIMTTEICDTVEKKAIADLRTEQIKAEQTYAKADPATQQKWKEFKEINKPLLEEIDRLSNQNNTGGLGLGGFGGILSNAGFVLVAGLAVFLAIKIFGKK